MQSQYGQSQLKVKFIKKEKDRKYGQIRKGIRTLPWYRKMKQNIKVNHVPCIDKKKNYMKIMLKNTNKSKDNLKVTIR